MKTLKQQLQEYFTEVETGNIIAYVYQWLTQKRPKTASSEYEHGKYDTYNELLEELNQ